MKTTTAAIVPEFEPIQVSITFETSEELQVFESMISRTMSIPQMIYHNDTKLGKLLQEMMHQIYCSINNNKE